MKPFVVPGVYINDLGDESSDCIREAFGINYDRLAAIKNRYDPRSLPLKSEHRAGGVVELRNRWHLE